MQETFAKTDLFDSSHVTKNMIKLNVITLSKIAGIEELVKGLKQE